MGVSSELLSATLFYPPCVRVVGSFEELVGTAFSGGVNALCWQRELAGDFVEVAATIGVGEGIVGLDEESLGALSLSHAGKRAVEVMLADQALLVGCGLDPILDCIYDYPQDAEPGVVPTDVYSWHVDSATAMVDTYLCCYHGPPSEGLANEEAVRKVDVPEIRACLHAEYGGAEGEGFERFLRENCFDLHYAANGCGKPYSFGVGNLWRIAVQYPGSPVAACIHRAPVIGGGELGRLLLIS